MKKSILIISLIFLVSVTFAHATQTDVIVFFVQNSQNIEYDAGTGVLILKDVSPTTIWFTDRPERMAGHETVQRFVDDWGKGKDSFAANPPNATLSVFEGDQVQDAVVVLSNPRLKENDLIYNVDILEGKIPAMAGVSSLFIDSEARQVARRTARRTTRRNM